METSRDTLEKLRDIIMLNLSRKKISTRDIGVVMNVHQSTVSRRLKGIPPNARAYYEKSMERLA